MSASPLPEPPEPVADEPAREPAIIEVAFKGNRKQFFLWSGAPVPATGTAVIVEADRGEDYGVVHSTGELALRRGRGTAHGFGDGRPTERALRVATRGDRARHDEMRDRDEPARREAMERVRHYRLAMKLCDAEWRWDRQRLVLYFSSEQRVDFRELVRDLAARFRTRIELRQIGVRDEAKRLSGIGRCGREYCSAAWLPELKPVNLGVAKDQRLSLNPTQISGACGRLMCCLRYEHDFYVQQRKRFPKDGKLVQTAKGEEKVLALDIFRERVTLRAADGEVRTIALADFQREAAGGALTEIERPEPATEAPDGPDGPEPPGAPGTRPAARPATERPAARAGADRPARDGQRPSQRAAAGGLGGRGDSRGESRGEPRQESRGEARQEPRAERRLPVQDRKPPRPDTRPDTRPAPPARSAPPAQPPAAAAAPAPTDAPTDDEAASPGAPTDERRRRRGRRGGRRHRPGGGAPPPPPGGGPAT